MLKKDLNFGSREEAIICLPTCGIYVVSVHFAAWNQLADCNTYVYCREIVSPLLRINLRSFIRGHTACTRLIQFCYQAQELINRVIERDLYSLVHEGFFPLEDGINDEVHNLL